MQDPETPLQFAGQSPGLESGGLLEIDDSEGPGFAENILLQGN